MARRIRSFFDRLFHRDRLDREMNEEISLHIAERAEEFKRQGISAPEALRRARLEFGGLEKYKEQCRETRRFHLLHDFIADVRFAARLLHKTPGFTVVVLLTLTLGVGANTTMFTLLDAVVLRELPVPEPRQLVHFGLIAQDGSYSALSLPMFEEISQRQRVFSSTFLWWGDAVMNVEVCNTTIRSAVYAVDGNFYSELGAVAQAGRLIGPNDASTQNPPVPVAVLGEEFLKRHCGGNHVIGQLAKVEGVPFTVIGIAPAGFTGVSSDISPEVTIPLPAEPFINGDTDWQKHLQRPAQLWLDAAGRLKPGVSIAQAQAQIEALWPSVRDGMIARADTQGDRDALRQMRARVESISKGDSIIRARFHQPVSVLLAISGLLLLLACVNLAGLMLVRASARSHELGVRVSLGASRGRLARQMLTESLLLSVLGTAAGFLFALWASRAMSDFVLGTIYIIPAKLRLTPDARMLSFTIGIALLTGVVFGLAPAWSSLREDPNRALQRGSRSLDHATSALGKNLVIAQIALSLVLVAGAGLLIRSLNNLRSVQPGFRISGVLTFDLFPKAGGYRKLNSVSYYRELTDRVSRLPGVESAGLAHSRFGNLFEVTERVRAHGQDAEFQVVDGELVMPGLFATMQIPLLRGRDFTWRDDEHASHTVVISQKLAQKLFPGRDPIGQHLDIVFPAKEQEVEVVGVVGDASLYDIRKAAPPTVYLASTQYGHDGVGWSQLMVRTSSASGQVVDSVRATVDLMQYEYVPSVATVRQELDRSILQERATGMLSGFIAVLALLLAAVGLYGLLAYTVARRTREIGIRVTLGAGRGEIRALILRETIVLLLAGCGIGLLFALLVTRLIAHMLFGVSAHDPMTIAATIAALVAVGMLAAILPSWRAMRVDPIVALRCE